MKEWWQSLEQRERYFVGGLGIFLAVFLLYIGLIDPLYTGASEYYEKVAQAEQDLAFMQRAAPGLKRQPAAPANSGCGNSTITVIVDRTRKRHQIVTDSTQTVGDDGLRVRLEDTPFDAMIRWLGDLRSQHCIAIEAANLRPGDAPGTANATLTLRRQ